MVPAPGSTNRSLGGAGAGCPGRPATARKGVRRLRPGGHGHRQPHSRLVLVGQPPRRPRLRRRGPAAGGRPRGRHRRRRGGARRPGGRGGLGGAGGRAGGALPRPGARGPPRPSSSASTPGAPRWPASRRPRRASTSSTTRGPATSPTWSMSPPRSAPVTSSRTPVALPPRTDPRRRDLPSRADRLWSTTCCGPCAKGRSGRSRPASRLIGCSSTPTLDFGKTTAHSLMALRHTEAIVALGFPVLQALSRKDFIGETLDLDADDRLEGHARSHRRRGVARGQRLPCPRRAGHPPSRRHGRHDPR